MPRIKLEDVKVGNGGYFPKGSNIWFGVYITKIYETGGVKMCSYKRTHPICAQFNDEGTVAVKDFIKGHTKIIQPTRQECRDDYAAYLRKERKAKRSAVVI